MQQYEKHIRTDLMEMWIKDGILFARYLQPTVVDLNISKKALKCRQAICEGKPYPILGDCTNIRYWTKQAKQHHASDEYAELVTAVAVIIKSPIISIFYNFYNNFYPSRFPVKAFTCREEAIVWLSMYKYSVYADK